MILFPTNPKWSLKFAMNEIGLKKCCKLVQIGFLQSQLSAVIWLYLINKSSKLNIYSFLISYFVERIKNHDRIDGSLVLKFFHLFSEHPLRGKFTFLSDGGVMVAMIRMCWGQVSGERSTQASEVCYKWLFVKLLQQEILIVTIQLVNDVKKIAKQNSFYTESW